MVARSIDSRIRNQIYKKRMINPDKKSDYVIILWSEYSLMSRQEHTWVNAEYLPFAKTNNYYTCRNA